MAMLGVILAQQRLDERSVANTPMAVMRKTLTNMK
jgi:hypothetical protein